MGKVRRWMLILCAIFMVLGAQSVYADDTQDSLDGYWSKDENQEMEDGETVYRYFLWDGTMITDQWAKIEEEWYFFDAKSCKEAGFGKVVDGTIWMKKPVRCRKAGLKSRKMSIF